MVTNTVSTGPKLRFVNFTSLLLWDVKRYLNDFWTEETSFVRLKDVLKIHKKKCLDRALGTIPVVKKINFFWELFLNDEFESKKLKWDLFEIPPGSLIYSKINLRHGCIYFHEKDKWTVAASSEYPVFMIDESRCDWTYLWLALRSERIKQRLGTLTTGISKARTKVNEFLNIGIPLPDLMEQKRLVGEYRKKMSEVEKILIESDSTEVEIETYIKEQLWIQTSLTEPRNGGLNFIEFKDLYRWDALSITNRTTAKRYPLRKLWEVFDFITRPWNKAQRSSEMFHYIEIGWVDWLKGITETVELPVKDAPSRATQIVKEGDLIIGTTRPYLKKFAIVTKKNDGHVCSSGFSVIRKSDNYNLHFLLEFLFSSFGIEQLKNNMSGALYPAITSDKLKNNVMIPSPPLKIQEEIIAHIWTLKKRVLELKSLAEIRKNEAREKFDLEIFWA